MTGLTLLWHRHDGATPCLCRGVPVRTQTHGVEVTIIDFTLSRLTAASGQVHSCDLSADPALFQGRRGDCQVWALLSVSGHRGLFVSWADL